MAIIPGQLQVGSSFEESMPILNSAINAINDENQTKIIRNSTTPNLILGYQKGGFGTADYGLKIAKPGIDVTTATNDQLAFSSAFDTLKVVASGTTTVTIPAGYSAGTYDSLVNYSSTAYPIVMAYVSPPYVLPTDKYILQLPASSSVAGANKWLTYATVGSNYVDYVVDLQATGLSGVVGTWTFKYYLLQESAN